MKKFRKVLALTLCAAALVGASVFGTMAYLQDSDAVTNTFTVGKVGLELDETDVKLDGSKDTDTRVKANDYKLIPGQTYIKDPTVTVAADSEDSYVRMLVTLNYATELKAIFGDSFLPQDYVAGWDSSVWVSTNEVTYDNDENTLTYEFRHVGNTDKPGVVAGNTGKLDALFDSFTLPGSVTNEQLSTLVTWGKDESGKDVITDQFKINVTAHAIQADGFTAKDGKTAEDVAWEAFDGQVDTE